MLVVAPQDNGDPPPLQHKAPKEPPRFGGGWARSTIKSDLTPEEERLREALRKSAAAANPKPSSEHRNSLPAKRPTISRNAPQQVGRLDDNTRGARAANANVSDNWDCSCGYINHRDRRECRSCSKPAPPSKVNTQNTLPGGTRNNVILADKSLPASQQATGVEKPHVVFQNPPRNTKPDLRPSKPNPVLDNRQRIRTLDEQIASTRASQPRIAKKHQDFGLEEIKEDKSDPTQDWKHLRRKSDETSTSIPTNASEAAEAVLGPPPATSDTGTVDLKLDKERLARLEKTKDGRFVGLHADSKARVLDASSTDTSSGYEKPKSTPSHSISATRRTPQPNETKVNGLSGGFVAEKRGFGGNYGSWNRWKPSPTESTPGQASATARLKEKFESSRSQQGRGSVEIGRNKVNGRDTNVKPFTFSSPERPSTTTEPIERGWTRWSPDFPDERPASKPEPDKGRGSAEDKPSPVEVDAQSGRVPITYAVKDYSDERPATEWSRRTKKKSRGTDEEQIDELQLARRSFKAESSAYTRGLDRDRSRKKARKYGPAYDEDEEDRIAAKIERSRQRKKQRAMQKKLAPPTPIYLPEFISVSNLAAVLRVRVEDFASRMTALGFEETGNDHILDAEVAGLIAAEFNFEPIVERGVSEDLKARPPAEDKSLLAPRPPIVTIMGHVDHGKTTLLDWLRKSSVVASEFGGITQHIGAFSVQMPTGKIITFLDTPGHAAFLSMRQRGANVTDIVILVVAADDSVKPQTVEAIKHAQAAKVPIIVAVNKVDKEDANVERVKQDLARYGVEIEDYGGDTQVVCVSGKTGQGMEELEDAVVALADILDMRAETDGQAEGWVLEATTKKAGRVATVLVRRGTLRTGDVIVAGTTWARVRSLKNEAGIQIPSAGPGTPAEIDGWREQPIAGDEVLQATDEQQAKSVVDLRREDVERSQMALDMTAVNEARRLEQEKREAQEQADKDAKEAKKVDSDDPIAEPAREEKQEGIKEVFFLIKGDVFGSVEAVLNSVSALGNSEVRPRILRSGVGPVSGFDIEHAAAANGHVIAFNVPTEPALRRMAEQVGVKILEENIIYRLIDDVKAKLSEMLPPLVTQRVLGEAEVAQVFEINVKGHVMVPIAGCRVRNGVVARNAKVRVLRAGEVVYDGTLTSLKIVKKDVTETRKGNECGMGFEKWTDFRVGDQVQSYEEKRERRYL